MPTPPVTWNLTDLYAGADDPKIVRDLDALEARAAHFADQYRGRVGELSPAEFGAALQEYEAIARADQFPGAFASLLFAADTATPAHGALMQMVSERGVAINRHLLFFTLELIAIPDEGFAALLAHPVVASYRHYLEHQRAARPHRLSEAEEQILMEKSVSGGEAFSRLFDETISAATFPLTEAGATREVPEEEILTRLYSPDRAVREAAASGLTEGLLRKDRLFTFITNTLVYDKMVDDRLTHFPTPEAARHLDDEVDTATVHTMLDACVTRFPTVARYYRLKREILGLDTLYHYDRYAPITSTSTVVFWLNEI